MPAMAERASDAIQRVFRILMRLAGAGALAAVAGIVIGAVATGGGLVQLLVTFFAAVALWIPAFILLTGLHRWRRRRGERAILREEERVLSSTGLPAWKRLADQCGEHRPRLIALYRQLVLTREALPAQTLDPEVHECRILIEKRIPQLIDARLDSLPGDQRQRGEAIGELIDLVERFASDCREREERMLRSRQAEHDVVRRRIESHISGDPLA